MFVFLWSRWINHEKGTRSDVPHNMIYPLKDTRPNLHFLTGVHVKHVTFDECVFVLTYSCHFWEGCTTISARIGRQASHILSTRSSTLTDRGIRILCEG